MNPFPGTWTQDLDGTDATHRFVLLDGAMQHELGQALGKGRYAGRSFFDQESKEAQALGPWLLDGEQARAAGIDGIARGITWLAGMLDPKQAFRQLQPWIIAPFPDGVKRGYLRLGDGRVLRAMLEIWSPRQRAAFCAPWRQACCADRDGHGWMLPLPAPSQASYANASPRLDERQYQALLDSSTPDLLLHELKSYVTPHASLSSRESRHEMAVAVLEQAKALDYDDPSDQMSLIGWALAFGDGACATLPDLPAVREHFKGDALWDALMASSNQEVDAIAVRILNDPGREAGQMERDSAQ